MWLSSSSVGRKFIMALTGACLVLFVTFHCLMNAVAICWPAAYNQVCMFLGANWYALLASAGLAVLILIHIIYAIMLTVQNRRARGSERYLVSKMPKNVEWSSRNMFVLGIVILAFLAVHMIQFWAKMQLVEVMGWETEIPAVAGTLFIQEAFSQVWTPIVYIIGFCALWFHMNHGFWSMFQSIGWDSTAWIPRLKCIGCWWVTIVIALFVAEAVVFYVRSNDDYYKTNTELRAQYKDMLIDEMCKEVGEGTIMNMPVAAFQTQAKMVSFEEISMALRQSDAQLDAQLKQLNDPQIAAQLKANPEAQKQIDDMKKQAEILKNGVKFLDYLEGPQAQQNPALQQMPY
ncbi:MAG: hypothetical protein NC097_04870 [Clostridium sp.]|nr:hypothetical protein [Clostridium sp.]